VILPFSASWVVRIIGHWWLRWIYLDKSTELVKRDYFMLL
jgi:hypothetical protein